MIVTIREAIHQHSAVVEKVVGDHFLWCPVIMDIVNMVSGTVKCTMVRLNDDRQCNVVTNIREDGPVFRIQTEVSPWEKM